MNFVKGITKILFKFEEVVLKTKVMPIILSLIKFDYLISGILTIIIELMK